MEDTNLIIFVHTCKAYEDSRAKKIYNTWGSKDNVVFITDNPNSKLKNHIYIGPYKKGPTYHPENVVKMFDLFINRYENYDWFMIIDDDSYLYVDKLVDYLKFNDKNDSLMVGDFLNWPCEIPNGNWEEPNEYYLNQFDYNLWIGGGSGIVFTKKCIIAYLELIDKFTGEDCNHDLWLHRIFQEYGSKIIKRIHCCGFHQYGYDSVDFDKKDSNLLISVHLNNNVGSIDHFHKLI
tara:strand:+ start:2941 stop:3645 length:705 start_codon:yes stop_codon:yes gene_type:complete